MAFLISVFNLDIQTAKALIIDSAIKWNISDEIKKDLYLKGNGIVPIDIKEIIKTKDDEIKFFVQGVAEKYETFFYLFPVPVSDDKFPFKAKAVLSYFTKTNRNQGIDYTNTELDVNFGRMEKDEKIKTINSNSQKDIPTYEKEARRQYQKWNNVKIIMNKKTKKSKALKIYENNDNWGLQIYKKERLKKFWQQS